MSATTPAQEMDIVKRLEAEADAWDQTEDDFYGPLLREAKAEIERLRDARAAVIEECAKVADRHGTPSPIKDTQNRWWEAACTKIAEDIRALANRSALPSSG